MAKRGNNYRTYGKKDQGAQPARRETIRSAGPAEQETAAAATGRKVKPLPEPRNSFEVWVREKGLTGTELKLIAMVLMVVDHIGHVFLPGTPLYWSARYAGRLAFPIFAFLTAEGIANSSNLFKYALRLLTFAVISEIPYDYVINGSFFYWDNQNILFTLFAAVLTVAVMEEFDKKGRSFLGQTLAIIIVIGGEYLGFDYGIKGMAIIFIFYYFRNELVVKFIAEAGLMAAFWWRKPQMFCMTALPLLYLYSGKRGEGPNKYVFYAFYTVHLIILGAVAYLLNYR